MARVMCLGMGHLMEVTRSVLKECEVGIGVNS